jgi:WD40 repeat protein
MKNNLKNYIKNNQLFQLVLLCAVFFSTDALAMRRIPKEQRVGQSALKSLQRRAEYEKEHKDQPKNQYFLYATDDPNNGIWVDKEFLIENCEALRNMIADFGEMQEVTIPIGVFPLAVIKLGFDILADISRVPYLSLAELINVANIFNFLGAPADKMQPVLDRLLENLNKISDEELKRLNPDVQKSLMTASTVNYLKNCIIKKYAQKRKQVLVGHSGGVRAVAFSFDGKRIVSGGFGDQNNLILWDMSDPNNITHQVLQGHQASIYAVAFSPNGNYIVLGCQGDQNNLIVLDVSNPNNITSQVLVGHPKDVNAVAFSPDGKYIVSGCTGDQHNLIVWDMSDPNNITHQDLVGHPKNVFSVAFSSDGKRIVSGCAGGQHNLIVWDMSNPNNITHQVLEGHPKDVYAVVFSPDGKRIVSGGFGNYNNLIVWDMSNPNNITHQVLEGHRDVVVAVGFSPDGKYIVSGSLGDQNNLIVWDVSNPNNITHQVLVGHPGGVDAVAFSPDGKCIVSGGYGRQDNLIVWTLLTDQEDALLKQLTDYSADQMRLIYQLRGKALRGETIKLSELEILPQDMQKLLTDLLL